MVLIVILAAGVNSTVPEKDDRAESRPPTTSPDRKAEKDPAPKPTEEGNPKGQAQKDKPKEDPRPTNKEKLLRDATALQGPPLGLGKGSNLSDFAGQMRKLATDEFAFKDAQAKVYWASFDQKSIQRFSATRTEIGRNVIVFPGTYDFGQKRSPRRVEGGRHDLPGGHRRLLPPRILRPGRGHRQEVEGGVRPGFAAGDCLVSPGGS
jgi:hypothetical protein